MVLSAVVLVMSAVVLVLSAAVLVLSAAVLVLSAAVFLCMRLSMGEQILTVFQLFVPVSVR